MPPKHSLGKGLGAMFPDLLTDMTDRPAFITCGIEELVPNRFQPRQNFRDAEQQRLVQSIRKNGIIQPILARKSEHGYEIIAGERRWRAAQEAGLPEVPVILREATDRDLAEVSLIENLQREDLDPVEEAHAYQTLIATFGLSQEDVSAKVGRDRSTVANTLRLLKLPGEALQALTDKKISAGHGRALLAFESPGEQRRALALILKRNLSVRETENLVQLWKRPVKAGKASQRDPYVMDLEKTLSSSLKAAVTIQQGRKKGSIQIAFQSTDELNRLSRLLMETPLR
jgi:ParB family chromosome partitioning protein